MTVDAWQLIERREFESAVQAYSKQIEEHPSKMLHFNRTLAYLGLHDYRAAEADCSEIARINSHEPGTATAGEYLVRGTCQWCLSQPLKAIDTWRSGLSAPYRDAAGGVKVAATLLYAAVRIHDGVLHGEALNILLASLESPQLGNWPGPIAPYLLGNISEEELLARTRRPTSPPVLVERFQCQAKFYMGLYALERGDMETFKVRLRECAASWYGFLEHEHYLATWEVEHDFTPIYLPRS